VSWLFENLCVSACVVCVRACFRCVGSTILRVCRLGLLTNVRANLYLCVLPIPQLGCDFCSGFFDILYGLSNCNSHFHSPFSFLLSAFPHVLFSSSNCVDQKEEVVQVRKNFCVSTFHASILHRLYLSVYTMFTYMQHK
jgi:hypothetical protein